MLSFYLEGLDQESVVAPREEGLILAMGLCIVGENVGKRKGVK
jgi:hypothetical protein